MGLHILFKGGREKRRISRFGGLKREKGLAVRIGVHVCV
jgi:hypothetical protein